MSSVCVFFFCFSVFFFSIFFSFFFNDTATTEIYTLSLHDALPSTRSRSPPAKVFEALAASGAATCSVAAREFLNEHFESGPRERSKMPELVDWRRDPAVARGARCATSKEWATHVHELWRVLARLDADDYDEDERSESTRLNSSHTVISYAVFCLKKKKKKKKEKEEKNKT